MLNFDKLVNEINTDTKVDEYLLNFFTKKNFKEYEIKGEPDKKQLKAIKIMFESKKSIADRIEDAFVQDPFCIEAIFSNLMINEDVFIQLRFNTYMNQLNDYPRYNDYCKDCFIKMLNLYVDFLLDINNCTKAIEIQKLVVKLTNKFTANTVSKLAYAYFTIEDEKEFYKLYTETKFDTYEYLLLMATLLKHDENLKAQEVLLDMYENIEYGTYLDHVWDLDLNDSKQKEFHDTVNDCFESIKCIPTFFSWVNKTREKYGK